MLSRFILQHDPCTDQRLTCSGLHNTACQIINWPLCFVEKNALLRRTAPSLMKTSYHCITLQKTTTQVWWHQTPGWTEKQISYGVFWWCNVFYVWVGLEWSCIASQGWSIRTIALNLLFCLGNYSMHGCFRSHFSPKTKTATV